MMIRLIPTDSDSKALIRSALSLSLFAISILAVQAYMKAICSGLVVHC